MDGAARARETARWVKIGELAALSEDEQDQVADMLAAKPCRSCRRPIGGHSEADLSFCASFHR